MKILSEPKPVDAWTPSAYTCFNCGCVFKCDREDLREIYAPKEVPDWGGMPIYGRTPCRPEQEVFHNFLVDCPSCKFPYQIVPPKLVIEYLTSTEQAKRIKESNDRWKKQLGV